MGHHKRCCGKRCKYKPTELNHDKIIFPNVDGNRTQGVRFFCEQIRAFPIGKRHC